MTALLIRVLGRLPIGWLQLSHNRGRLAAAVSGVVFANVLVLMQLGILGAMNNAITLTYDLFEADVMISAEDADTLTSGGNVPRQRLFQALADPGTRAAAPLMLGTVFWNRPGEPSVALQVIGVDPDRVEFMAPHLAERIGALRLPDVAFLDRKIRGVDPSVVGAPTLDQPLELELQGRRIHAIGAVEVGGTFSGDGTLLVSDQTFTRLFVGRTSRAPDHVLVKAVEGVQPSVLAASLRRELPTDLRVRTFDEAQLEHLRYETTRRPTGLIFGFGVLMGTLVGLIIVYQILSTDVADHLREYATFKAMGYDQAFFIGVILEEAVLLGSLGFIPGLLLSFGTYRVLEVATSLPVYMTPARAILVFLGTIAACAISGAIATRRLARSDPAELF